MRVCVVTQQGVGCRRDPATDKFVYDTLCYCDLPSKMSLHHVSPVVAVFVSVYSGEKCMSAFEAAVKYYVNLICNSWKCVFACFILSRQVRQHILYTVNLSVSLLDSVKADRVLFSNES